MALQGRQELVMAPTPTLPRRRGRERFPHRLRGGLRGGHTRLINSLLRCLVPLPAQPRLDEMPAFSWED
jgi:hypothetical protein